MTNDIPEPAERNAHTVSPSQRGRATTPILPVLVSLVMFGLVHQVLNIQFVAKLGGPAINMVLTDLMPILIAASMVITSACAVGCYANRRRHD